MPHIVNTTKVQNSKLLTADEEALQNLKTKNRAIQFIAKMKQGKPIKDTVRTSRLIPTRDVPGSSLQVKLFSAKQRSFLMDPATVPSSSLKTSGEAYVGPHGKLTSSGDASMSQQRSTMLVSTAGDPTVSTLHERSSLSSSANVQVVDDSIVFDDSTNDTNHSRSRIISLLQGETSNTSSMLLNNR